MLKGKTPACFTTQLHPGWKLEQQKKIAAQLILLHEHIHNSPPYELIEIMDKIIGIGEGEQCINM